MGYETYSDFFLLGQSFLVFIFIGRGLEDVDFVVSNVTQDLSQNNI
jgi:hypothetical protein